MKISKQTFHNPTQRADFDVIFFFAVPSMGRDHEESQKDMHATDHVDNKHVLNTQMLHVGHTCLHSPLNVAVFHLMWVNYPYGIWKMWNLS